MLRRLALALALLLGAPLAAQGLQSHSPFPLDLRPGPLPRAVMADGRPRLVYELHLVNAAPFAITLTGLTVTGEKGEPIATLDEAALDKAMLPAAQLVATPDEPGNVRALAPGQAAVIFCDLTLAAGAAVPARLLHHVAFTNVGNGGATVTRTIDGLAVPVAQGPAPLLRPPLRGGRWVAFNALFAQGHRRAYNAVDGRLTIAERFAIDWMSIGADGRLFRGDGTHNRDYYGYGADVLAVADGRVVFVKDDMAELDGQSARADRKITLENATGNALMLDIGGGRYAVYAHLQPGSVRVKQGQVVKAGAVLAKLGNSGNSDAPHLHFQLMEAGPMPLAAEGLPYGLTRFSSLGRVEGDILDEGKAWTASAPPQPRAGEFPLDQAVLTFP